MAWLREDRPDLACDKILDAAEKVFVERGVPASGMAKIARAAGCSRGTLYRYFPSRHDLHLAYVNRAALAITERVRADMTGIQDPRARLVEGVLRSVRAVRESPGTAVWFDPAASGMATRMSRGSEVVGRLTTAFVRELLGPEREADKSRLRARWLVRIILSLLTLPGESAAEERALVERFVPVLLGDE